MITRSLIILVFTVLVAAAPAVAFDNIEAAKKFCKTGTTDAVQATAACCVYVEKGDPHFKLQALDQRGLAFMKREWWAPAFAGSDTAVKIDLKFADSWNNRGWTLLKMGRPKEALGDFERAITLKKDERYITNREIALKRTARGS